MTAKEAAVIRAALRLYKHWVKLGPHELGRINHWYPVCSEVQAKSLGRACKAMRKEGK